MLKSLFVLLSSFALTAHAATLQDPTYTTAYYTSVYPGIYELNAVNNNGLAVGEVPSVNRFQPAYGLIYDSRTNTGQSVSFAATSYDTARLTGINDNSTFVGYGIPQGLTRFSGFVGSANNNTYALDIPFNVPGAVSTFPRAINDSGVIVGSYISPVDNLEHGFIYRPDGTFETLDNPAFADTTLVGINNHGQIVGTNGLYSRHNDQSGGFLYTSGSFVQLSYGLPLGINDGGAVAITVSADAIAMHVPNPDPRESAGILYPNGTLALLYGTNPFSPQVPEFINGLAAMNNEGLIIFNSGHAFVGTPVIPEPASVGLLLLGAAGLVAGRIFHRRNISGQVKVRDPDSN